MLRDLGFDEVVAWSLVDAGLADRLRLPDDDPRRNAVAMHNPVSADQALMRTTLLGGLLDAARHNLARGAGRLALFESGRAYLAEPPPATGGPLAGEFSGTRTAPAREPHRLAAILIGDLTPVSWQRAAGSAEAAEFFSLKGALEVLAAQLGVSISPEPRAEPFLHPGRAAAVLVGGSPIGWLGELHPLVARAWDLPGGAAFELDLAPLLAVSSVGSESYEDVMTHPAVLQDLAVTTADDVPPSGFARRWPPAAASC